MNDFLVRGSLAEVDPAIAEIIQHEHAHQFAKLLMIASESTAPAAVREAEGSVLQNLYAEGYPHADMHGKTEAQLLDYDQQMTFFRRFADRRYYRGAEYNNLLESLCQRRGAEAFCPPGMSPEQLYLNVQPLAGAVANTAVYEALVQQGDTVMGLDLLHGGHLTHGSPVNHSGRHHRIVFYRVNEQTEHLDYDEIYAMAMREKPKMIIAGFTSYPFAPDFKKFREIADACGAYLLADISHTAGLAITGEYPNPVGIAHVTTFTTHKTLMGPRGAVIITTDPDLAKKIDRAVFPGMQGGPHMNKVAGIAVAFKLAVTPQFKALQSQIAKNAKALAAGFAKRGAARGAWRHQHAHGDYGHQERDLERPAANGRRRRTHRRYGQHRLQPQYDSRRPRCHATQRLALWHHLGDTARSERKRHGRDRQRGGRCIEDGSPFHPDHRKGRDAVPRQSRF